MNAQLASKPRSVGSVIQDWRPEDAAFWAQTGQRIANRNLAISIPALLLAFAIWQMFSAVTVSLPKVGFRSKIKASVGEVFLYQLAQVKGDVVDLATLKAADLVGVDIKRVKLVKQGDVGRALTVRGIGCTEGAKAAIVAAGGSVE